MKRKVISIIVILTLLFGSFSANSYAYSGTENRDNVFVNGNMAAYGIKDSEKLVNIIVNLSSKTVNFAVKYNSTPNYVYEYIAELSELPANLHTIRGWDEIINICKNNRDNWKCICITDAVIVKDQNMDNSIARNATVDAMLSSLMPTHGTPFTGRFMRNGTFEGLNMTQYQSLEYYGYLSRSYYVAIAISVASLITGIWGLVVTPGVLSFFGAILGAGGLISVGNTVYQYNLFVSQLRYVVVNNTVEKCWSEKLTSYIGYGFQSGSYYVDTATMAVSYTPSQSFFNDYQAQFQKAFNNYYYL
ncbi:MAG: hypothetical protein IKV79_08295 [Oscillospiraceae bacterium]|nr:hypothetical protein [Oscillospiraceae bacterium]